MIKTKLLPSLLCASFLFASVTACQPKDDTLEDSNLELETAQLYLTPSAEAQAIIQDFKSEYVTRSLNQQENQLAAYHAMQSSDSTVNVDDTSRSADDAAHIDANNQVVSNVGSAINIGTSEATDSEASQQEPEQSNGNEVSSSVNDNSATADTESDDEEEVQTEVQKEAQKEIEAEREAKIEPLPIDEFNDPEKTPLPLATIVIPPPEELTAEQLEMRYLTAMQDLYLAEGELLPPQSADTLLSVATLIPDVFKNTELARRLTLKSPAMARLLRQYQVWEQIEAQQSIELAELKVEQREAQEEQKKKFAELMAEFDETIKGYDEQIAKYEKLLKEFED